MGQRTGESSRVVVAGSGSWFGGNRVMGLLRKKVVREMLIGRCDNSPSLSMGQEKIVTPHLALSIVDWACLFVFFSRLLLS
jgi:hypothetical protein